MPERKRFIAKNKKQNYTLASCMNRTLSMPELRLGRGKKMLGIS